MILGERMAYYFRRPGRGNDLAIGLISVVDVLAGIIVFLSRIFVFTSNPIVVMMSLFYFCLGIWSLATNILRKSFFVWREIVDIVSAVCLFSVFYGSVYGVFGVLGIIIVIKGMLSFFSMTTKEQY